MQPKVSVIIPVYNAEQYLRQCLDSVVNQTLEDIQIIIVDDGSKDSSGTICMEYAEKFEKISFYSQENAGSAAARNTGLSHAEAEYIGFVDSDDWIEPDMYEKLYAAAKENQDADIVMCRVFEEECPGAGEYIFPREGYFSAEQIREEIIPYLFPSVMPKGNFRSIRWSNVIRLFNRNLIEENTIRSCEGVSNCEDLGFLAECTLKAVSYYYLTESLYHNRPNPVSQSRNYVSDMWPRTKKLITDMHRFIDPTNDAKLSSAFDVCIFYFCTMILRNECRIKNRKQQLNMISMMLGDPECGRALKNVSPAGMNEEYKQLYTAMTSGSAVKALNCIKRISLRKKILFSVVEPVLKNRTINRIYRKLRGR